MKRTLALLAVLLTVTGSMAAAPAKLNDSQLKAIQFDQKLGQQVSLDLPFVDERGRAVRLSDCIDGKPAIVELGYFGCPMLCTLVLNGLISTLQDITPSPGHQFSVIFVSINPSETPALAAAKKATYLKQYGRHGTAAGWHFLTGSEEAIALLADQVGYRYAYDPVSKQYAHPSGLVLLTPDGKVSRYFFGISFEAKDMDQALKVAASEKIGSEVRQFIYLCFHYSPIRGKYGALIMEVVRAAGIITMVGLACLLYAARRPARDQGETGGMRFPILPATASAGAQQTDAIFFSLVGMSVFFLAIIFIPMIFILFKYRSTRAVNRTMPKLPHTAIEITWMVLPLLICLGFFAWAGDVFFDNERPPANAIQIDVVGKQWMWKIEHAEGNSEINQLHVPMGTPVNLTLASQDVIHSFFIPAFRIKQDVVPGRYTSEWFKATKAGTYHIFCSQYCGTFHAQMIGQVIVMEPAAYEKWLSATSPGETLVQKGARRFRELGCSGCHMSGSIVHAPRLEGVFGKPVPLQDGRVVFADESYIRDCILLPTARVPAGYQPVMPTFQGHVSEEDLLELIAYVKSLANVKVQEGMP